MSYFLAKQFMESVCIYMLYMLMKKVSHLTSKLCSSLLIYIVSSYDIYSNMLDFQHLVSEITWSRVCELIFYTYTYIYIYVLSIYMSYSMVFICHMHLKNCCTGHQTSSEDFIGTKLSSDYYLPKLYCQRTGIKEEGGECCGSRVPLEVVLLY